MDEQEMRDWLESGGSTVYIICEVGNPEDDEYVPQELYIKHVDWDDGIVELSRSKDSSVIDRSPFEEVFKSYEDAMKAIDEYYS